jgi:large repetitive protein
MTLQHFSRALVLAILLALVMPGGALAAAPVANDDSSTVAEDADATEFNVLSNDTDDDSDPITIVDATDPPHGTVQVAGDGLTLSYEPDPNYDGADSFQYTVSDGSDTDTADVDVTVTSVNDAPNAVSDSETLAEDTTTTLDLLANDQDPDDPLDIVHTTNGSKGVVTITHNGADVRYDPNPNATGADSFTYTISDGTDEDTATVNVSITAVDDPPVAIDDSEDVTEDVTSPIDVRVNDTDIDGGPKVVQTKTNGAKGSVVITGGGAGVSYDPNPNATGSDSFTYTLNGGSEATVVITIVAVDDLPIAIDDNGITVAEDAGVQAFDVLDNDTDVDGGPMVVTSVTAPSKGTVSVAPGGTGVRYTPTANATGADTFDYSITGGSTATVSVSIDPSNDPPTADPDSVTVKEDAAPTVISVFVGDIDIDGDVLTIQSATNPVHGTVVVAGNKLSLTYEPDLNYHGPDSFIYTLSDGHGGSDTATVTVTVTSVNDDPVPDADSISVVEDALPTTVAVLAGDTDVDLDVLVIQTTSDPTHGIVVVALDDLTLSYKPDLNYFGSDTFTYTVSDGQATAVGTVSVTVTPVDDPPVAAADSFTVAEDAPVQTLLVLVNDTDIDAGPKSLASVGPATKGSTSVAPGNGAVRYTPAPDATGADSFSYTLNGGSVTTVSVTITPTNDAPVTAPDSLSIPAGASPVPVPVLVNDTDIDGDALRITGKTNGAKGAVAIGIGGTSITYQPFPGLFGSDSFTYTIGDGHGGTALGTVSVTITSGNHAPNAVNDARDVPQGAGATPLTILANDQDADGNSLTIIAKTDGAHGTVAITGGGTGLTYNPVNTYHGTDTFTYIISDGLASDMATVRVTVVRDTAAPIVLAPTERFPGHTVGTSTTKARLTWSATDLGSGISRYQLQVRVDGGPWKAIALPKATSRTIVRSLTTGHTYRFRVRAVDGEGNVSGYVQGPLLRPVRYSEASVRVTYTGVWAKTKSVKALGGAARHATSSAKRAKFTFTGYDVGWIATTTTKSGKARIYIDGVLVATIDLDRTKTAYRKLIFARHFPTLGPHTLEIQPVGDGRVDIDGFVTLR